MFIDIKDNIIEIKAEDGLYLKDTENNVFEGICFKNNGQTEEELRKMFKEITEEEKNELELLLLESEQNNF